MRPATGARDTAGHLRAKAADSNEDMQIKAARWPKPQKNKNKNKKPASMWKNYDEHYQAHYKVTTETGAGPGHNAMGMGHGAWGMSMAMDYWLLATGYSQTQPRPQTNSEI